MKKIIILAVCILALATPQKSLAVGAFTGIDPVQAIKEMALDTVGWLIGGIISGELTRSTSDWVNSGFSALARSVRTDPTTGEPVVEYVKSNDRTFVVDPQSFFTNLANGVAEDILNQIANGTLAQDMTESFIRDIADEIRRDSQRINANLDEKIALLGERIESEELRKLTENFSSGGGWSTFLEKTQKCINNESCVRGVIVDTLREQQDAVVEQNRQELAQGGGYLTIRECIDQNPTSNVCEGGYKDVTPGQLIGEQISQATRQEFERLNAADEITEVMIVLFEQALNALIDKGLSELSNVIAGNDSNIRAAQRQAAAQVDRDVQRAQGQLELNLDLERSVFLGQLPDVTIAPRGLIKVSDTVVSTYVEAVSSEDTVVLTRTQPWATTTVTVRGTIDAETIPRNPNSRKKGSSTTTDISDSIATQLGTQISFGSTSEGTLSRLISGLSVRNEGGVIRVSLSNAEEFEDMGAIHADLLINLESLTFNVQATETGTGGASSGTYVSAITDKKYEFTANNPILVNEQIFVIQIRGAESQTRVSERTPFAISNGETRVVTPSSSEPGFISRKFTIQSGQAPITIDPNRISQSSGASIQYELVGIAGVGRSELRDVTGGHTVSGSFTIRPHAKQEFELIVYFTGNLGANTKLEIKDVDRDRSGDVPPEPESGQGGGSRSAD